MFKWGIKKLQTKMFVIAVHKRMNASLWLLTSWPAGGVHVNVTGLSPPASTIPCKSESIIKHCVTLQGQKHFDIKSLTTNVIGITLEKNSLLVNNTLGKIKGQPFLPFVALC